MHSLCVMGTGRDVPFTLGCWYQFRSIKTLGFPNSVLQLLGLPSLPASTGVIWLPPLFPAAELVVSGDPLWLCGYESSRYFMPSLAVRNNGMKRVKTVTKGLWILVDRQSYCRNFDDCWVRVSPKTHMWLSWYCIDLCPHARWISRYFILFHTFIFHGSH